MTKLRIVIDVDGVICANMDAPRDYSKAVPYPFAIARINKLYESGHQIILLTARYMTESGDDQEEAYREGWIEAARWMKEHGVKYHKLMFGKPAADLYLDDKGWRVESAKGEADWEYLSVLIENMT